MAQPWHRGPWHKIRTQILNRDKHLCQIKAPGCQTTATHVDHITSPADGGPWYHPDNLRAACQNCNLHRPKPRLRRLEQRQTNPPSRNW